MPVFTTTDGVEIFYKDWGSGQPIVFSHGWPLSADDWDTQMLFFVSQGFRVIAHDRRGHGRSAQVGEGHDMDHYADDLAALTAALNLRDAVHIGHSTGGGEVIHYLKTEWPRRRSLVQYRRLWSPPRRIPAACRRLYSMTSRSNSPRAEASSTIISRRDRSMGTTVRARRPLSR
jgi:pimeloyl-ACP methyl ester carboxylesterase